eukprot:TRINITY_DN9299_c0_g1_i2.p1 TRINITY_DN9299_c0_g1~~TRINITY_DN9299_c0_g1_i2.p1  ORF type:complete len:542 (-),score=135.07 TRINITY_DN9299_c0_g1_i2:107-1732(-)
MLQEDEELAVEIGKERKDKKNNLKQGFRANWIQISVLVYILITLGSLFGIERTLLPLMAEPVFGVTSNLQILLFVVTFGLSKAIANGLAGTFSDIFGRKLLVILGTLLSIPVSIIILIAIWKLQYWVIVSIANLCLGASQGFAASAIVLMLIEILGKSKRGIAVGLLECTIYVSMSIWSFLAVLFNSNYIPFMIGLIIASSGFVFSFLAKDTMKFVKLESDIEDNNDEPMNDVLDLNGILDDEDNLYEEDFDESFGDLDYNQEDDDNNTNNKEKETQKEQDGINQDALMGEENESHLLHKILQSNKINFIPSNIKQTFSSYFHEFMSSILFCIKNKQVLTCTIGGITNNMKDGIAWGILPNFFTKDWSVTKGYVAFLLLVYPLSWGILQLFTGILSDKLGRKIFLTIGFYLQSLSFILLTLVPFVITMFYLRFAIWVIVCFNIGLGTAFVYPVLQAAISDETPAATRGKIIGVYRFCRDMGYVIGAIAGGIISDFISNTGCLVFIAICLGVSGSLFVLFFKNHENNDQQNNDQQENGNGLI